MTPKQFNRATEIFREIKEDESIIIEYERIMLDNDDNRQVRNCYRRLIKDASERIKRLKSEFENL